MVSLIIVYLLALVSVRQGDVVTAGPPQINKPFQGGGGRRIAFAPPDPSFSWRSPCLARIKRQRLLSTRLHLSSWKSLPGSELAATKDPTTDDASASPSRSSPPSPLIKFVASPLGALVVLSLVVLCHEGGHYLAGRALGAHPQEFSIGFGPKVLGFRAFGDDDFSLRALPVGGYVSFDTAVLRTLPTEHRLFILSAGIAMNIFLAFSIYLGLLVVGPGLPRPVLEQGVVVAAIMDDSEAPAIGILRPGDVIVAVNGGAVLTGSSSSSSSPTEMQAQRAISKIIKVIQATPDGKSLTLTVERNNKVLDLSIQPRSVPSSQLGETPGPSRKTIGVILEPNIVGVDLCKPESILEGASLASERVISLGKETVIGLVTFTKDLVSGKAGSSEYRMSGPVGVIKRATNVVSTRNLSTVLQYAAALSINLGVLNSMPIPPSDGFQILITLFQAL